MKVHLIDGTYELFRHHYGQPKEAQTSVTAATRGVCHSVLGLLEGGATHLGVATDHVIESFRNAMWPTYKTSEGMPEEIKAQFQLLEDSLESMGVKVWAMTDLEADDALASAAAVAAEDGRVEQVIICTPDKDLGQCVVGDRVVQLDRRKQVVFDEAGVTAKFGVGPASIPDYLGLVGDTADGFPGLPGWGAKSAAAVLAKFLHIEAIPEKPSEWGANVRSAPTLAATLNANRDAALLFRDLATLRIDRSLLTDVNELEWTEPRSDFAVVAAQVDEEGGLARRAEAMAARRRTERAGEG